ncbi:hypothetical protein [uncultured Dysosmobacter sp.]|uniref:hypothetical protein n=1 Tax=uncultured Dysosmobacter sp. TaxID=2591384 RepID=UPI0026043628|nr:hypothetical protein [uncultured Dysosmobacter sp.]
MAREKMYKEAGKTGLNSARFKAFFTQEAGKRRLRPPERTVLKSCGAGGHDCQRKMSKHTREKIKFYIKSRKYLTSS